MDVKQLKRCATVAVLTLCALAVIGGVLHSPIDVLSGATPRSAAKHTTKLTGNYVLTLHTAVAPWTIPDAPQAFTATLTHSDAKAPMLAGQTIHLAIPAGDDALGTFAAAWQKRLAAQGITLDVTTMDAVRLRSRMLAGKYETVLGPDDMFSLPTLPDAAATTAAGYEMR